VNRIEAVVIGASAGAVEALSAILPKLPRGFPPVAIVVHMPPDRHSIIAELFQARCEVKVKEAEDKEPLSPSVVYFAPPDYHLLIESSHSLSLSADEHVHFSRPAIDVLFQSAADVFGANLVGIVLSGANSDGAAGLNAVCDSGGIGLVQSPETSFCATMPQAALVACPSARCLSASEIGEYLRSLAGGGGR